MFDVRKAGRLASVATLAASTALAGPLAAYANDRAEFRVAQADGEAPAPAPAPELSPEQQQQIENTAPAEDEAPEAAEEPAAPPAEEPQAAPEAEPAPEPEVIPDVGTEDAPAPPDVTEPPVDLAPAEEQLQEEVQPEVTGPEPDEQPEPEASPGAEPSPEPDASGDDRAAPPAEDAEPGTPADEAEQPAGAGEAPAPASPTTEAPQGSEAAPSSGDGDRDEDRVEPSTPDSDEPAAEEPSEVPAETPAQSSDEGEETPAGEPEAAPRTNQAEPDASRAEEAAPSGDETNGPSSEDAPSAEDGAPLPDDGTPQQGEPAPDVRAGGADDQSETQDDSESATARPAPPEEAPEPVAEDLQLQAVPEGGVAASDARVQTLAEPVGEIPSARAERGERIETTNVDNSTTTNNTTVNNTTINDNSTTVVRGPQPEIPPGVEVVETTDDGREILSLVGAGVAGALAGGAAAYFIRGNDSDRLTANAEDSYYERLGDGRVRQTVVRENGVQVVTISNRYGETIQRSRILPDGREVVLFYDPYAEDADSDQYLYDPGADLPPLRYTIPEEDYIVDVARPDRDLYYRTIVAPPVETVERIYSVDEVRRSERIRDKVRRIDLNTINFAFGSADIAQEQVENLQALASAISDVIDQNPDETFLIEGHTDAVGSDLANLALSDRRAETVAGALTTYFDVPPENIITQGYGEQFLKVNTQDANEENRRVTVRRITPLVKPVQTSSR